MKKISILIVMVIMIWAAVKYGSLATVSKEREMLRNLTVEFDGAMYKIEVQEDPPVLRIKRVDE